MILVAYASKHGSTAEVADSIAATLGVLGVPAEVVPADEVDSLDGYDGIVLGGPIYMGRWHRNARGFAKHYEDELRVRPTAVFALGPVDDVEEHRKGSEKQFRQVIAALPFEPVATALFGGAVDPDKLAFPFSRMPAADARDWDAIRAWATTLADSFLSAPTPASA